MRFSSLNLRVSIMVLIMIVIATAVIGVFSYNIYRNDSINSHADKALVIADLISESIDGDSFQQAMETLEYDADFEDNKKMLDTIKSKYNLQYLYVVGSDYNDNVIYYTEGTSPGDIEPFEIGTLDGIEFYADEMFETIDTGVSKTTEIYDSGESYGMMVSGFSAIKNSSGKVVGVVGADMNVNDVLTDSGNFALQIIIAGIGFSILFVAIALLYIRKTVGKPLKVLSESSKKIASGDIDITVNINSNNEIGILANDLMQIKNTLQLLTRSINTMSTEQNMGDNEAQIDSSQFEGAFKTVAEGINGMVMSYVKETNDFISAVESLGQGDFDVKMRQFPGKKAKVNSAIESIRGNLKGVSTEILVLVENATKGQLSKRIDEKRFSGDWAKLAFTLNELMGAVNDPIEKSSEILEEIANGRLQRKLEGKYYGDFEKIQTSLNRMTTELSVYISEISSILNGIADNDFRHEIGREYIGDFSNIKTAILNILTQFKEVIGKMRSVSERVSSGSLHLSLSGKQLAEKTSNQSISVQDIRTMLDKLEDTNKINMKNTSEADKFMNITKNNAESGRSSLKNMLVSMELIETSSKNISKVVKVIEDIALQTNLLALNASVEAARAGEQGKGFAVVAEEVRNLAARSQNAVNETSTLISESVKNVKEGSEIANHTANSFNTIVENIEKVSTLINSITKISDEQNDIFSKIERGVEDISDSAMENSATSEEAYSLSSELMTQAEELKAFILKFKL